MKPTILVLLLIAAASVADALAAQEKSPTGGEVMLGYYGRPGAGSLGVLGQYSIEELVPKMKAKAREYEEVTGNRKVIPAFHLIYGLASSEPGRDKDYLLPLSHEKVMRYINAAKDQGFAVIIDTQLGGRTPAEAIKPVLKYLKYDNVHLAIDPEFEVSGLEVRPGKVIGHVTGEQINQVQAAMLDYMKKNDIKERKILIVHMFTKNMVRDKKTVKLHDDIALVMNLDGHGSPKLKTDIYNGLYTADRSTRIAGGFKLFFREDKPAMMTPKQVMGLEPVGSTKIKEPPRYINYQ